MNTLQAAAGSPWWLHAGAALILFLHIAGGTVALAAGAAALALRKGSRRHAFAGHFFFGAMIVMAAIGAIVSLFLVAPDGGPRWFDSLAGCFACYLVATGWTTVRRRPGTSGRFEIAALLFAALGAAAAMLLGGAAGATGSIGGYDATGYYVFAGLFALAAAFDVKVVANGGIAGVARIARHLWRMCAGLFIAAGAFFLGQQRVMPEWMQGSPLLVLPPLATLGLMLFWLLRVRLAKRFNAAARNRRLGRRTATAGGPEAAAG